jgi:D-3-phosphoglycerate dehydrogenase
MMDYLENGNIVNSVNFPGCDMGICTKASRIAILHGNIPNSLSRFTSIISAEGINISDMLNRSRGGHAYTMLDLDHVPSQAAVDMLQRIQGVYRVRVIK